MFEEKTGVESVVINGEVASGLRFYKEGCPIIGHEDCWDEYIEWQLHTVSMIREVVLEIGL